MQVFYRGEFIKEVGSKEEAQAFIKKFQKETNDYYEAMINEAHKLEKEIISLRTKKRRETFEEYNEFVKTNHRNLFSRLEALGKEFFKEKYVSTYVYNSEDYMYGWVLKTENGERKDTLANIGLKICTKLAMDRIFKIR